MSRSLRAVTLLFYCDLLLLRSPWSSPHEAVLRARLLLCR